MGENEELKKALERLKRPLRRRCVMCGTEFEIIQDTQYFCSDACSRKRYVQGLSKPPEKGGPDA